MSNNLNVKRKAKGVSAVVKPKVKRQRSNAKVDKLMALQLHNAGLSCGKIAEIQDVSRQAIHRSIRTLLPNEDTEIYKTHRANILSEMQRRLLVSIDDDDIQKTPAIQRITGAAILFDKERLERGQSTSNTLSVTLSGPLTDAVQRITTRQSQPDNPCQTTTNSQSTNTINKIDKS